MKPLIAIAALVVAAMVAPAGAEACRFRRPGPPMIPEPYDALVVARAPADIAPPPGATGHRWVAFRVTDVLDGSVLGPRIRIRQELEPAPDENGDVFIVVGIGCGSAPADRIPLGHALRAGQRVLAVVRRVEGVDVAISWAPLDEAMRLEPFVALYLGTRDPAQRRWLADRWRDLRRRPVP